MGLTNSCSRDARRTSRPLVQSAYRGSTGHIIDPIATDQHSGRYCHTCSTRDETATSCLQTRIATVSIVVQLRPLRSASPQSSSSRGAVYRHIKTRIIKHVAICQYAPSTAQQMFSSCADRGYKETRRGRGRREGKAKSDAAALRQAHHNRKKTPRS